MAATTLIDNAVRVTITHSDSAATASEAATAFVNLDDATRTDFNWKPIPETCDRIMVVIPRKAANHRFRELVRNRCQDCGADALKRGGSGAT